MAYLEIEQYYLDESTANGYSIFINGVAAKLGDVCNNGDVLSLVADSGYEFFPIYQANEGYHLKSSSACFLWYKDDFTQCNIPFDVTNPKIATWTFPEIPTVNNWRNVSIPTDNVPLGGWFEVETTQATPEVLGSNNVYVIDNEILAEVNAKRFRRLVPVDNTSAINIVDYGQFILSVLQIPSTINPDLILEQSNIQLGDFNSGVLAPELTTDNLRFNMGSFEVPQTHNNLLDFSGVVCNLHLPFSSSIVVDVDYVVGQTLSIEYLMDCYTGVTTINLSSSKVVGEVFYTANTSLGINIPFIGDTWGAPENSNINIGGNNHILKPYLEVISNDAILIDGFFTIPIIDESAIGDNIGFIKVEEINLTTSALSNEISEIKNILASGVIINA